METYAQYYKCPVFRPSVRVLIGEGHAEFSYDRINFTVDFDDSAKPWLEALTQKLRDGLDFPQFCSTHTAFAPHADELLQTLDRYGFIRELHHPNPGVVLSGGVFWKEVRALAERVKSKADPQLYSTMRSTGLTRAGLVAYAVQYYHFVKAGPQIIAASIPHTQNAAIRELLEAFFVAELGHDKLMLRALQAADIDTERVRASIPLPETFALLSGLQVLADQEPLSFYASVFLVEDANPEFHEALIACCREAGLPEAFWAPFLEHAHINEGGDHGSISAELLAHVDGISSEARMVALKQVATTVENLVALEHAIIRCNTENHDSLDWCLQGDVRWS